MPEEPVEEQIKLVTGRSSVALVDLVHRFGRYEVSD
jgi:hypothetical protein